MLTFLNHFFFRQSFPIQYKDSEEVVLWMNTIGPYPNRQERYKYFSLPFCRGSKPSVSHHHETIAEALQGVELEFSGIDIDFKGDNLLIKSHLHTDSMFFSSLYHNS